MLVDTNHPEETRVVVIDGTRLEAFDLETSTKKQNKGNIYLAKVVRVEPSLQAAFVDYGGNRHGFLAFSEIHPDYYQIPVADREALIKEVKAHEESLVEDDERDTPTDETPAEEPPSAPDNGLEANPVEQDSPPEDSQPAAPLVSQIEQPAIADSSQTSSDNSVDQQPISTQDSSQDSSIDVDESSPGKENQDDNDKVGQQELSPEQSNSGEQGVTKPNIEEVGGEDETEGNLDGHRKKFVASRRYKIQEVIKRKQILLIQVVKEERGNKGAALTTYLSLAGRYCVLMPNSARGGGVSRKITNTKDRRRLKSIVSDLKISEHMAVILRTAGAERSKAEIKRDYEYLQRTWNQIRELTMESRAPALIHEEANLIKRSIRDVYSKDIEEILVEGEEGYKAAKEFMKTLTPSHAKKVQRYKEQTPLFQRYQIESQLDAMHSPTAQLKSGGSIVFGQTEALVAIDVNSGKATKERHIEETALKTNLEAADEIARQLRLRDLAGLVVIDFIDMDEHRNNTAVERRLKEALKVDRARIQVGRISHFGLLELSRQRLRPSLMEANFEVCKACTGTGMIRSIESTSIQTLRSIEEEGLRHRTAELTVTVNPDVALYILNYKRVGLEDIQKRYEMNVYILGDKDLIPPDIKMERIKGDNQKKLDETVIDAVPDQTDNRDQDDTAENSEQEGGRKRRRRKRKRKRPEGENTNAQNIDGDTQTSSVAVDGEPAVDKNETRSDEQGDGEESQKKGRRRGRRGGRRRRKHSDESSATTGAVGEDSSQNSDGKIASEGADSSQAPEGNRSTETSATATPASITPEPPIQTPDQAPKSTSRFLGVFRKGAEALRSSVSDSNDSPEKQAPEPKPAIAPVKPEPSSPTPPPLKQVASPQPEEPSGPPRKGWWNNDP